jgi:DHA2 family multidrug resistance protein
LIFAPINVAAFMYIPKHLRGAAVGMLALLRNEGGSVGTSMSQTIQERREQFHTTRINEFLDPLNSDVNSFLAQSKAANLQANGDPVLSQQMAWQSLAALRDEQAAGMAYFDVFWISAILAVGLIFLILFMKRSVAEKGAHVGAE